MKGLDPSSNRLALGFILAFTVPALAVTAFFQFFPFVAFVAFVLGGLLTLVLGVPLYAVWPKPVPSTPWPYLLAGLVIGGGPVALLIPPLVLVAVPCGLLGGLIFWLVVSAGDRKAQPVD